MKQLIPGEMEAADFLKHYWQKQPCLIPRAISNFKSFISKQDLFALTHREEVESRLILESGGDYPWQVKHGPFNRDELSALPKSHWALLIQNTELHLAEAAAFLDQFNFIPNWRIDDLMISLASKHGSVGPHLDSYDVFLFQAIGKRRWRINTSDFSDDDFIDGLDLRIIDEFKSEQEWLLEPGDMLYLPPGVAHHGIALDDCMTFSIGFRAPSNYELVGHYLDDTIGTEHHQRYTDPALTLQEHRGEITSEDMGKIDALFRSTLPETETLSEWFGKYITRLPENCEPIPAQEQLDEDSFVRAVEKKRYLSKNCISRTAFIRRSSHLILFVNGVSYSLSASHEEFVCRFTENIDIENPFMAQNMLSRELSELLRQLYNEGIVNFEGSGDKL